MKKINMKSESIVKKTLLFSLLLVGTLIMSTSALAVCQLLPSVKTEIVTYFQLPDQPDSVTDSRCSYVINGAGRRVCRIRMRGVIQRPDYNTDDFFIPKYPAIIFNHGSEHTFEANRKGCEIANYFVPKGYIVFVPFRRGQGDNDGLADKSTGRYIEDTIDSFVNGSPDPRDPSTTCQNQFCYRVQLLNLQTNEDVIDGFNYLKNRTDIKSFVTENRTEYAIAISGSSYGGRVAVLANQYELGHRAAVVFSPAAEAWGTATMPSAIQTALMNAAGNAKTPAFYLQAKWDYDTRPTIDLAVKHAYGGSDPTHGQRFMASIFEYPKPCPNLPCTDAEYQSVHVGFTNDTGRWGPAVLDFLRRNGVK